MSFWTMLSCCFATSPAKEIRPKAQVSLNGTKITALLDTGSSVTLVNSKYKKTIVLRGTNAAVPPAVRLCGADGKELITSGCFSIRTTLGPVNTFHNILFVDNLQVPCILGMDFMGKSNIILDTRRQIICIARPKKTDYVLMTTTKTHLPANSETLINLPSPVSFVQGLVESKTGLPEGVHVMDGITSSVDGQVGLVVANFSHLSVNLPPASALARLTIDANLQVKPLTECLSVTAAVPRIVSTSHVDKIDLSTIPSKYVAHYRSLLRSYADVFSKNDLDIGHCRSLPHRVRMRDPHRITSINQYRLPHHLKGVAIDYVKKLLAAGVVRKSTSVFNSPLMLVKKPHADPKKPLAEQYRLVHNYV